MRLEVDKCGLGLVYKVGLELIILRASLGGGWSFFVEGRRIFTIRALVFAVLPIGAPVNISNCTPHVTSHVRPKYGPILCIILTVAQVVRTYHRVRICARLPGPGVYHRSTWVVEKKHGTLSWGP